MKIALAFVVPLSLTAALAQPMIPLAAGVRAAHLFADDGAGNAGAEFADPRLPASLSKLHAQVELAAPHAGAADFRWTLAQLDGPGAPVVISERSGAGDNLESLSFSVWRSPSWRPGRYRVELALDGHVAQDIDFTVEREATTIHLATIGLHRSDDAGNPAEPVTWFRRSDHRVWLRVVTSGCGGVPLHAALTAVEGDAAITAAPVASFESPALPESARTLDVHFDSAQDWAPGTYRADVWAGDHVFGSVEVRIE